MVPPSGSKNVLSCKSASNPPNFMYRFTVFDFSHANSIPVIFNFGFPNSICNGFSPLRYSTTPSSAYMITDLISAQDNTNDANNGDHGNPCGSPDFFTTLPVIVYSDSGE